MQLPTHPILRAVAWLSAAFLAAGCSSSDSRAQAALGEYQSAAAANDLAGARRALLQLVQAKDDVADYWVELAKLQASMGSYGDAYYAYTRAYELNRSDPEVVRQLTALALRTGDVDAAQNYAGQLQVVSPDDPLVKLAHGWAAIGELRFDDALALSDSILAGAPFDSGATELKGRALIGLGREDEAIDLLTKQVQAQPADGGSLELLARVYEKQGDWAKLVGVAQRLTRQRPGDREFALTLVEAALRSGNIDLAKKGSFALLRPNAQPALVSSVLDLWAQYWNSPERAVEARKLASVASGQEQKMIYAAFLNRVDDPADALRLASGAATLPVDAGNAEANAVFADSLSRLGKLPAAKARFDAVIAFDPGNASALRGRSELELRTRNTAAAIEDAQKLVSVLPKSSRDRLLLARAYSAAGKNDWAQRTLWTAFQEIPGDETIFAALKATRAANGDAMNDLRAEFVRQRDAKLKQGLL